MDDQKRSDGPATLTLMRSPEGKYLVTSRQAGVVKLLDSFNDLVDYLVRHFEVTVKYDVFVVDTSQKEEKHEVQSNG